MSRFPHIQLLLTVLTVWMIASCGSTPPAPPAMPPVPVVLAPVQMERPVYYEGYPATVTALRQVELRPQVSGFVTGIHVEDGARVRKGQLLYSIDAQLYAANYEQAQANLLAQQANLAKAEKDAERYRELARHDAVARQLVDNAEAALEVARRQVEAAKANIAGVQTSVRYTKVVAPFDGVIGVAAVRQGAAVVAGQTLLNTISSDDELAVDFFLGQHEIFRFNQLTSGKTHDSLFTLMIGSYAYPFPGRLAFMDRAVDPQTATIRVRLIFPNPHRQLKAGMSGTVRMRVQPEGPVAVIPHKAIVEQLGKFYVFVPTDSNRVTQRTVVPGTPIGSRVIVHEGLHAGEMVVAEGVQQLREGVRIQPDTPASGTADRDQQKQEE